jgi:nicotinamidase-related amidase
MRIKSDDSLLLVIDLQARLLPAIQSGDDVLANAAWMVDVAQALGIPVIATEHCPKSIGLTEAKLRTRLQENIIVEKTHFSAVSEGTLFRLPEASRKQWVVIGTEAHVCVQQTVLDLLALGRSVYVVDEAIGSRRARDKELALQRMRQNGAEIVSREMVAFEWLERANTQIFRDVLKRFIK